VAGLAVVFAEPFQYCGSANFRILGVPTPAQIEFHRSELLNHAWQTERNDRGIAAAERWAVEFPEPSELRLLCRSTTRGASAVARITRVGEAYIARTEALREELRKRPTQQELALSIHASELQARYSTLEARLEAARRLSSVDPQLRRATLLESWNSLSTRFNSARQEFLQAASEIARLKAEPAPTHGIVPTEERREALEADVMLQQDLRELLVRLSEVKLHLLNVWRESSGKLDQLATAVDQLVGEDARADHLKAATDLQRTVGKLLAEGDQYEDLLKAFAGSWTSEFNAVRQADVDPLSSGLLDAHERTRKLANDFLYRAGKHLAAMRTLIQAVTEQSSDHARHYVLQSNLVRAFQAIQTAHHRLEFASGPLDTPENFRLDSALRSARGLHRRSQQRINLIDQRLQAKAVRLARERRNREIADGERRLENIRETIDQTVEELIAVQKELNRNAERLTAFLQNAHEQDVLRARLEVTESDLADTRERLRELATKRLNEHQEIGLELVSVEMQPRPANLLTRCRTGGIAALLALLALVILQWHNTRRARSNP
jgi:hypothetical protein